MEINSLSVSSISGAGNTGLLCIKGLKSEHFLNSKWVKNLNVRPETIKLLEENIGSTLLDINHSKILYDPPPRIMEIKTKINKWT